MFTFRSIVARIVSLGLIAAVYLVNFGVPTSVASHSQPQPSHLTPEGLPAEASQH